VNQQEAHESHDQQRKKKWPFKGALSSGRVWEFEKTEMKDKLNKTWCTEIMG
jgi:hypothetical protein